MQCFAAKQFNVLNVARLCGIGLLSPRHCTCLFNFFLTKYFRPLVALNLLPHLVLAFKIGKTPGGRGALLKQQWQKFLF